MAHKKRSLFDPYRSNPTPHVIALREHGKTRNGAREQFVGLIRRHYQREAEPHRARAARQCEQSLLKH